MTPPLLRFATRAPANQRSGFPTNQVWHNQKIKKRTSPVFLQKGSIQSVQTQLQLHTISWPLLSQVSPSLLELTIYSWVFNAANEKSLPSTRITTLSLNQGPLGRIQSMLLYGYTFTAMQGHNTATRFEGVWKTPHHCSDVPPVSNLIVSETKQSRSLMSIETIVIGLFTFLSAFFSYFCWLLFMEFISMRSLYFV